MLRAIPGAKIDVVERCSAVDGTWGMKAEHYEEGARYAERLAKELELGREQGEKTVVTDCSLAALRMLKQTGTQPKHPIELLAEAYAPIPRGESSES